MARRLLGRPACPASARRAGRRLGHGPLVACTAAAFGPVLGTEPSVRMREVALAESRHPHVSYVAGRAEDLPVGSASADDALMSCSWHHVRDQPVAVQELARVLRPGGRLLLRANFRDHHPQPWWLEHFPRGLAADVAMFSRCTR